MNGEEHPEGTIVNIISGKVSLSSVNVDNSVAIGVGLMKEFESTWPEVFLSTISKKVVTMAISSKSIQIGESKLYDLNVIYSRVIGLLCSDKRQHEGCVFT